MSPLHAHERGELVVGEQEPEPVVVVGRVEGDDARPLPDQLRDRPRADAPARARHQEAFVHGRHANDRRRAAGGRRAPASAH